MNYTIHYGRLIERAQTRSILPGEYFEKHHIIPRCLGGTDDSVNLVKLFPEEHYVAHQLLVKMHPDNPKLMYAVRMMCYTNNYNKGKRTNKLYGWVRKKFIEYVSSVEMHEKMSQHGRGRTPWNKGLPRSEETKKKISESKIGIPNTALKGVPKTIEHRRKISKSKNGIPLVTMQGVPKTVEHRRKMSVAKKDIPKSNIHREKLADILNRQVACPHCNKSGRIGPMHQWHFDNCKSITHSSR